MKKRLFARYIFLVAIIAMSGAALLRTSQSVQRAESEVADLKKSIERERQTIDVLQAEWAYLNSPYRLEKLALEHLHMVPSGAAFIVPDADMLPIEEVIPSGVEILIDGHEAQEGKAGAQSGVLHVSGSPARKPVPPQMQSQAVSSQPPAAQSSDHSVNGAPEKGFQEMVNRMGGAR